ncbi:DUF4278 domain-containing protein [Lusitaniella coriacea LEGE 07157]|uniref:DUF4278 domain-containing protein n=1 Tax=Lusitaniella coriacea LEGE 07157 TaxID=945747 RepID=A0A8J7DUU3_9CYAN|nr:DUF4278 domain-containing protein [Lusitaniella coriacea]MBE9114515.1 DUF4278 domain-containing protein [Lusitaniella coriacea LEGE 07157]
MKLSYRGVSYDYNPPVVETTQGQTAGKYRGQDWRFRNLKKAPVLQPTKNLVYRGVSYQRGDTQSVAEQSVQQQSRSLFYNREQARRNRQQSMLNRTAEEVGLNAQTI